MSVCSHIDRTLVGFTGGLHIRLPGRLDQAPREYFEHFLVQVKIGRTESGRPPTGSREAQRKILKLHVQQAVAPVVRSGEVAAIGGNAKQHMIISIVMLRSSRRACGGCERRAMHATTCRKCWRQFWRIKGQLLWIKGSPSEPAGWSRSRLMIRVRERWRQVVFSGRTGWKGLLPPHLCETQKK